ncbi:hypothetical protein [Amycolatopsis sp. WQ 127309]|uniref:hypothetical protein n=1 Tax=Amycolatopsis sp. WQ 127309 TaxID=2932773 RepID=UPI001FF1F26F|nr:hypothetical protein [Amycolatopsis sp. WQ 127309]UOZ11269.1 hypothetical protein MUY22_24585 [Amycolatopsis sp. WQ 127309]
MIKAKITHASAALRTELEAGGSFKIGSPLADGALRQPADLHQHTLDEDLLGGTGVTTTPTIETTDSDGRA